MTLPRIDLSGSPFEQGLQHGQQLKERIAHNVGVYFHRFATETLLEPDEVLKRAQRYAPVIKQQNPDYYAGMQGIAAGSTLPFLEIVALNVRYEIIYYELGQQKLTERDGCTAFAVAPERSVNGRLRLGQNWDWIPEVQGAVLHTQESNGLETLAFTEAGIVGAKIGMNSAEIGLAINGLLSLGDEWQTLHKPFHVRCYEILRQTTLEDAVNVVINQPRACAGNFLIAQTPNRIANIEAATRKHHRLEWENGCLAHTNHFVDPVGAGIDEPAYERRHLSCLRYDRMRELLEAQERVSAENLQHFLRDRKNAPASLCRLADDPDLPADGQIVTVTAAIIDLNAHTIDFTDGPPCQNQFHRYTF